MSLIQLFILAFALFAISRTVRQFRAGALTIAWLIIWMVFWLMVGGVVLAPKTTDVIASIAGVGRGVDFLMYISIIALFYLVFRLFVKIEDGERELTRLVRKMALDRAELPKKEEQV